MLKGKEIWLLLASFLPCSAAEGRRSSAIAKACLTRMGVQLSLMK